MGVLDDAVNKATTALGGSDAVNHPLMAHAMDLLKNNQFGGIDGLVQAFHDRGLGGIVSSWIGAGTNLPIKPEQIDAVLGNAQVQALAAKAGISPDKLKEGLSTLLPRLVDKMTPTGELPAAS
jgi:uncharacterized protein YidB (DUF937 family)